MTTEQADDRYRHDQDSMEASDLGWPAGTHPQQFSIGPLTYEFVKAVLTPCDELRGWLYATASGSFMHVWND